MKFEKVSFETFKKDFLKYLYDVDSCYKETFENIEEYYNNIRMPERSTSGSCGYDIFAPFDIKVFRENNLFVPTGIKISLDTDKFLMVAPRSSSAKNNYRLGNSFGIIDSDYYNNPGNEGDIIISFRYYGDYDWLIFEKNSAVAQGIIMPFFKVEDDNAIGTREGGFGSTDKK